MLSNVVRFSNQGESPLTGAVHLLDIFFIRKAELENFSKGLAVRPHLNGFPVVAPHSRLNLGKVAFYH
jgi:hypothetical protein